MVVSVYLGHPLDSVVLPLGASLFIGFCQLIIGVISWYGPVVGKLVVNKCNMHVLYLGSLRGSSADAKFPHSGKTS